MQLLGGLGGREGNGGREKLGGRGTRQGNCPLGAVGLHCRIRPLFPGVKWTE